MRMNPDHILVVDDDRELRELLERYLAGSGYRITTVANGRCARCSPVTALI
jgi:two-component system, OmpR family, response regulator